MDEVKPQDLSLSFLREFMNLPNSYFDPGAPIKYRKWRKSIIYSRKNIIQTNLIVKIPKTCRYVSKRILSKNIIAFFASVFFVTNLAFLLHARASEAWIIKWYVDFSGLNAT